MVFVGMPVALDSAGPVRPFRCCVHSRHRHLPGVGGADRHDAGRPGSGTCADAQRRGRFRSRLAGGAIAGPIGAFVALPVAALVTAYVSDFVPMNDVAYEFEYEQHFEAAKEAAEDGSASDTR